VHALRTEQQVNVMGLERASFSVQRGGEQPVSERQQQRHRAAQNSSHRTPVRHVSGVYG